MKNINSWLLVAIIAISISCNNNQKEEIIKDVISYSKIDSLLNTIEYERLDSTWMKSRAKVFKDKNIENDWAETGIIINDLDLDNIKDYIVISKNQFHPQNTEQYAIIAILGKSLKCYIIETYFLYEEEKFDGDTDFELPSLAMVKEGNKNMIYFSKSRLVDCISPKFYNSGKDKFDLAAESSSEELETSNQNTETPNKEISNIESSSNTINFKDIQMNLVDGSLKKAKIYLGEPDKIEYAFGHLTKGFAIYYNRVTNTGGNPKNLVLFLRMNGRSWGNDASIEEIYQISDNEKACFGIHCLEVANGKIKTNAANLNY